jgi:hypothetical protein
MIRTIPSQPATILPSLVVPAEVADTGRIRIGAAVGRPPRR